jgi:hypothetical protein
VSVFLFYFGWPDGAVWSNLLASLVCVGLAWWRLRAKSVAHHAEQLAQEARHHRELMAAQQSHHDEMKRHVAAHCTDVKEHVNAVIAAAADSQAAAERVVPRTTVPGRRPRPLGGERL